MTPIKIIVSVLDDQEYVLDLTKQMFQDMPGYEVSYFDNPVDFDNAISPNTDLVITDVRVGSGYDVIETVGKINNDSPSTYIIVMSQWLDVALMQELMRLNVRDTVQKGEDHIKWVAELRDAIVRLHPKLYKRAEIKATINSR